MGMKGTVVSWLVGKVKSVDKDRSSGMKRFAFLSVACGVVLGFLLSFAVDLAVPKVSAVDVGNLSEAAQGTIPARNYTKYRPKFLVIDFDQTRAYVRWYNGYMDGETFVPVMEDAYEFVDTTDAEGNPDKTEGTAVVESAELKAVLVRVKQFLTNKGKM